MYETVTEATRHALPSTAVERSVGTDHATSIAARMAPPASALGGSRWRWPGLHRARWSRATASPDCSIDRVGVERLHRGGDGRDPRVGEPRAHQIGGGRAAAAVGAAVAGERGVVAVVAAVQGCARVVGLLQRVRPRRLRYVHDLRRRRPDWRRPAAFGGRSAGPCRRATAAARPRAASKRPG